MANPNFTFNHDDLNNGHYSPSAAEYSDDELDRQIAEAAAGQSEYDSWKEQLAKDCLQTGVSFPTGHALQRAWNAEQKKRANNKKLEEKRAKIRARIAQLQAMLGSAQQELDNTATEENAEPDFDAIEADLLRLQQQRDAGK